MSVQVGVRVRPFNTREKNMNSVLCIDMIDNQTIIKDELGVEKKFTFDYSFWSHDGYEELEDGYLKPVTEKYADQKYVFDQLGVAILNNAWQGYHCCLFAYGQTGSGKSYSMVGYGANKGIVPISCEEIFSRINSNPDPDKMKYQVQVSMLEIYNEKIQDLLVPTNTRPPQGLKVREHKVLGIYVENLTKYPVDSYEAINRKMEEGYENRTIGSTNMNATSSRAHTIVVIEFQQIPIIDGKPKQGKLSVINLVDLAGSERAGSTGATGDRLKEGCNINKSLLVLGNVINALADKAMGKKKCALPPYRDSALTKILRNALGGNSKTVMICALSPASVNYEETLSTLRYADRAKKIQNKAVVNESEADKKLRLLNEENAMLKDKIKKLEERLLGSGGVVTDEDRTAFLELKSEYESNRKAMDDMQKTFEEKLEEAKKKDSETISVRCDITKPHLVVLNEDPQLSHKLKYSLKDDSLPVYVGRKHGNPTPLITLSGIGIKTNHAVFQKEGDNIILKPNENDAKNYIYINGKRMKKDEGEILNHKDRITFGTNTILIYLKSSDGKDLYEYDWEKAQIELNEEMEKEERYKQEESERQKQNEMNKVKQDLKENFIQEKKKMEEDYDKKEKKILRDLKKVMEKNEELYNQNFNYIESEKSIKKQYLELKDKKDKYLSLIAKKEQEALQKNENLENTVKNVLKKIQRMNIITNELKRNINLEVVLLSNNMSEIINSSQSSANIFVRVENFEEGTVYYWSVETFHNRYDILEDLFDKFVDDNLDIFNLTNEDDPLWDEPKPVLLGFVAYRLEPIAYLMNNPSIIKIISQKGECMGNLEVDIIPHDENGEEYEDVPDQPSELIGKNLNFKVWIKRCIGLNPNFCRNLHIEYTSEVDHVMNQTKVYNEDPDKATVDVDINETFEHNILYLSKKDIELLEKKILFFQVYAIENIQKKGKTPIEEILKKFNEIGRETELKPENKANTIVAEEVPKVNAKDGKKEKGGKKEHKDENACIIY